MAVTDFLAHFVEGYLFSDLRSMAKIRLAEGERYGAVGYPMVMTALSGVELLGMLTSDATFNRGGGDLRFAEFWQKYLYVNDTARSSLGQAVYGLVRHGIAHSYTTKPTILVTKHRDPRHLQPVPPKHALLVDALTLADDLEAAYFNRLKPNISGALLAQMEIRLAEMRADYLRHVANEQGKALGQVPVAPMTIQLVDPRVNSPSDALHVYSSASSFVVRNESTES